jgi:hypothetical protein
MLTALYIPDNEPYLILDTQTGEVVHRSVYALRARVRAKAERLNQAWGAFRYTSRCERHGQIVAVAKQALVDRGRAAA